MAHDDGDAASSSSSSGQELAATASIPQFAPDSSSDSLSKGDKQKHESPFMKFFSLLKRWFNWFLRVYAKYSHLLAAVAAPMSTLLDIPALAQPWYVRDGKTIPDRGACVALSSTSLALNIVAMVLLILRFSTFHGIWQRAADLSIIFWLLKTIVALCNLFIFGIGEPRPDNSDFSEGFWCAVFSVLIAGSITIALILHWLLGKVHPMDSGDDSESRMTGRKFLLSVTGFTVLVGFEALAFSQLENWRYLDAIYFSVQTALTVGYGDLTVQTAPGKVLLFIFAVLTLAQLGNAVSITIDWVQSRAVERRQKWLKKYSIAIHTSAVRRKPYATLIDEIALLHQINLHQESLIQLWDLVWALFSMFSFWCLGAMVFYFVEGWGYGNALYSVMVMSFTIGYGDFTPETAAGRVFWVCYAMMAVPVVTNFAVQTVTGILYTLTQHQFTNDMLTLERERDPETFAPHSHFVLRHHRRWEKVRRLYLETLREDGYLDEESSDEDEPDDKPSPSGGGGGGGSGADGSVGAGGGGDGTPDERSPLNEKPPLSDVDSDEGKHDVKKHDVRRDGIPAEIRPDEEDRMVENVLDNSHHKSAKQEHLKKSCKHFADGKRGHRKGAADDDHKDTSDANGKYNEKEWRHEPLRREQIEFYLLKQLIGRVTRLEAQARQMLIDSMDKDLAQSLLVADRNLQIRDAFQLYGQGDDEDDALKSSENAERNRRNNTIEAREEHIRQLEQETNLISGDSYDDDMLTRVRRYRSTFAEILVLSSTLLGLEGDDLKRFERWHIQFEGGGYRKRHHQNFKGLKRPPRARRKKLEQMLRRRNIDTDGKVRPPGYGPPGEQERTGFSDKPNGHHKHHKHHGLHHKRDRAPSSASQDPQSDTPHVDQAEAEGRISSADANAGRLPPSPSSESSQHEHPHKHHKHDRKHHEQHKKKARKRFRMKVWDAMEDELFRRTDKNVEDIIKAIPDEEEKEYLDKEAFARELLLTHAEHMREANRHESEYRELRKEARRGDLSNGDRGRRAARETERGAKKEIIRDAGPSQHFDRVGDAERGESSYNGQSGSSRRSGSRDGSDSDDEGERSEPSIASDGKREEAYGPNVWDTESDDQSDSSCHEHTDSDLSDEDGGRASPKEHDFAYNPPSSSHSSSPTSPRRHRGSPPAKPPPAQNGSRSRPPQKRRKPPDAAKRAREAELRRHGQRAHLDDVWKTMNAGPDHLHPYAPPGTAGYAGDGPHLHDEELGEPREDVKAVPVAPYKYRIMPGLT